jgi:hypothetical protein
MSIILDALKKSESDQQRQSGPALFEVRVAPPKPRLPVWAIAIVVLLAINMVVVGYLLLRRSSRSEETAAANTAAPPAQSAASTPAANGPPQAAYRPGQAPYQQYNGAGANYGQQPNNMPSSAGQPYNQAPNGAPPATADAAYSQPGYGQPGGQSGYGQPPSGQSGYGQPGGQAAYGQSGYGRPNGPPPDYRAQGGGADQFYNQPSNGGQSSPGGYGQAPYNGPPSNGPAASNNMGPSPANTRLQAGRDTNEPTLGNNSRDNAANDTAGNPDDYAPATDPQSPLFKGHVKRGTDSGLVLYQDAAVVPGANLPQLRLDLHVYAARPQDRFALINMHKMHEGDALPEGVRLESITPDGVIMSHNGSRFLLPRE